MAKRPSFQFYPADWLANKNLRRCSPVARGYWMDILCLLHDSDEYGILRWPLEDIAQSVGCPIEVVNELVTKGVLKGAPMGTPMPPFGFTPKHAGKQGDTVILIQAQNGPIWYSSRMVEDEHIRQNRAQHGKKGDPAFGLKSPKGIPMPPIGDDIGAAIGTPPSSSSSSSIDRSPLPPDGGKVDPVQKGKKNNEHPEARNVVDHFRAELAKRNVTGLPSKQFWADLRKATTLLERHPADEIKAAIDWILSDRFIGARANSMAAIEKHFPTWQRRDEAAPVGTGKRILQGTQVAGSGIVKSEVRQGGSGTTL